MPTSRPAAIRSGGALGVTDGVPRERSGRGWFVGCAQTEGRYGAMNAAAALWKSIGLRSPCESPPENIRDQIRPRTTAFTGAP